MTDTPDSEVIEPVEAEEQQHELLPDDHPIVRKMSKLRNENRDLRSKAARLAEIEEAQKTETEKAADKIAKAEAELAAIPAQVAEALRIHLVALHEIDPEDAELFLTATDPDLMLKQVTRLLGQDKRRKNHVPREGQTPHTAAGETDEMREFTRALFGGE